MSTVTESVEREAAGPKPTAKQLKYLRALANGAGETFVFPATIAEASAEIGRLKGRKPSSRKSRYWEERAVRGEVAAGSAIASEGEPLS
jgi:hypothetical protein